MNFIAGSLPPGLFLITASAPGEMSPWSQMNLIWPFEILVARRRRKPYQDEARISAEIPLLQLTRLLRVCRVTPKTSAASVIVKPRGSMQSWRRIGRGGVGFSSSS